jgi:hypothetical protein
MISVTDDPFTFRMPISLVRFSHIKMDKPIKPMLAMIMAKMEKALSHKFGRNVGEGW